MIQAYRRIFSCILVINFVMAGITRGQADGGDTVKLKPSGRPIALFFLNYGAGLGNANNNSGFNLTRAYLGYGFRISETLSARAVIDVAEAANGSDRAVGFKFATVKWEYRNLTVDFGLTGLVQFELQEKFWGYRYIAMSYQDLYKMGPSADLGIVTSYKFTDWIEADISITNGEGHRKLNRNNSNKYAAGMTLNIQDKFLFRLYGDIYNDSPDLHPVLPDGDTASYNDQHTISLFGGYRHPFFSIGAEYNYQGNKGFIEDRREYGYSVYSTIKAWEKLHFFCRYDHLASKLPGGISGDWDDEQTRNLGIAGLEYHPVKQLKFAPNYQFVKLQNNSALHYIYINVEFRW